MSVTNTKEKGELVRQPVKQWRMKSAVLAVAILAGGISVSAQALVLGQISIKSSLGEPIKAQIPVTKITSDESSSLAIKLAVGDDFKGRGLIYNSAIAAMRVDFKMTGNSSGVITITGTKPVQDPFVDLLLDVTWRTGSMQRSYTMLFDPAPDVMQKANYSSDTDASGASYAPGLSGLSSAGVPVTSERLPDGTLHTRIGSGAPSDIVEPKGVQAKAQTDAAGGSDEKKGTSKSQKEPAPRTSSEFGVTVNKGQTLGQIAASMKPAGVTQEQMLIALLRANPKAFINGNINWLRAGVTLEIPTESEIAAISQSEARREVSSHVKRFNERRLASAGEVGTVKPKKDDVGDGPKKGTVSQEPKKIDQAEGTKFKVGAVSDPGQAEKDKKLAALAQTEYANKHATELGGVSGDIRSLQVDIGTGTNTPSVVNNGEQPVNGDPLVPPSIEIDTGTSNTVSGIPDGADGTNGQSSPTGQEPQPPLVGDTNNPQSLQPTEPEKQPELPTEVAPTEVAPTEITAQGGETGTEPTPEKTLLETALENPLIPVGGLVGLLLVIFVALKVVRRKKKDSFADDSGMLDSAVSDSLFTESTEDSSLLDQSSSIYAASQLDTNADVDPLQEADVYLAYGRDEQAAEILRDAIQHDPDRPVLHAKLCEIYAKQGNKSQLDVQAKKLRQITGGKGDEWERVERLMQEMGGSDTLQPAASAPAPSAGGFAANFAPPAAQQEPEVKTKAPASSLPDLDISDVSLDLQNQTSRGSSSMSSSAFSMTDPASEIPDDEEGPSTRLALAEEFLAIGNKSDAKEIVEEVLAETLSGDLKERAQNLLNKAS